MVLTFGERSQNSIARHNSDNQEVSSLDLRNLHRVSRNNLFIILFFTCIPTSRRCTFYYMKLFFRTWSRFPITGRPSLESQPCAHLKLVKSGYGPLLLGPAMHRFKSTQFSIPWQQSLADEKMVAVVSWCSGCEQGDPFEGSQSLTGKQKKHMM